jgi:hypothetical protein
LGGEGAIAVGLVGIVAGGTLAYGGGMAQWGVNRKGRKTLKQEAFEANLQRGFTVPLMQFGGQW